MLERADIVGSWPSDLLHDVEDACGAHNWLGSELSLRYDDILDAPLSEAISLSYRSAFVALAPELQRACATVAEDIRDAALATVDFLASSEF